MCACVRVCNFLSAEEIEREGLPEEKEKKQKYYKKRKRRGGGEMEENQVCDCRKVLGLWDGVVETMRWDLCWAQYSYPLLDKTHAYADKHTNAHIHAHIYEKKI